MSLILHAPPDSLLGQLVRQSYEHFQTRKSPREAFQVIANLK